MQPAHIQDLRHVAIYPSSVSVWGLSKPREIKPNLPYRLVEVSLFEDGCCFRGPRAVR